MSQNFGAFGSSEGPINSRGVDSEYSESAPLEKRPDTSVHHHHYYYQHNNTITNYTTNTLGKRYKIYNIYAPPN